MADQKQVHPSLKYTCCHDCCMSLWRWDLILSNCVRLFYMHWAFQHINEGQWKRCLIIDRSLVCEQKTLTETHRHWACAPFKTQLRMSVAYKIKCSLNCCSLGHPSHQIWEPARKTQSRSPIMPLDWRNRRFWENWQCTSLLKLLLG